MWRRANLGPSFGWLWSAYAVSAYGTGIGFGAFSVVAITVLNASSAEVAALSASGLAIGAVLAGSRIAHRWGEQRVLRIFGTLRAVWPLGLAFTQPPTG